MVTAQLHTVYRQPVTYTVVVCQVNLFSLTYSFFSVNKKKPNNNKKTHQEIKKKSQCATDCQLKISEFGKSFGVHHFIILSELTVLFDSVSCE